MRPVGVALRWAVSRKRRQRDAHRPPEPPSKPAADARPTAPEPLPETLSPFRRWLFRAIVLLFPFAVLLAAELALQAFDYGVPTRFTLERSVDGRPRLLSNPRFTWLFFDPAVARVPPPFSLAVRKPAGAVRVFVLGSSAAQGDPEPAFGIARQLEVLLRDQYPGVD